MQMNLDPKMSALYIYKQTRLIFVYIGDDSLNFSVRLSIFMLDLKF